MRVLLGMLDTAVGGGRNVVISIAEELTRRGHVVGFLIEVEPPELVQDDLRALSDDISFVDLASLRRPWGIRRAARIVRRYDLLHSHTMVPGQILAGVAAHLAGRPHVVHLHNIEPVFSRKLFARKAQSFLYPRVLHEARFIAVAQHAADGLVRAGIDASRIAVIPNGAPPLPHGSPRHGPIRVGVLGRADIQKGLDTFVEAAAHLRTAATAEEAVFIIGISPGPWPEYEASVREQAAKQGVSVVEPGRGGREFIRQLDIVVIPSRYEGSPLVLFEAMAMGKTIIASAVPGMQEVLEPHDAGLLVSKEDPRGLAAAIRRLAQDDELRVELGGRAAETLAAHYSLQRSLDHIVAVLEEECLRAGTAHRENPSRDTGPQKGAG